jgi:hypothetical protein
MGPQSLEPGGEKTTWKAFGRHMSQSYIFVLIMYYYLVSWFNAGTNEFTLNDAEMLALEKLH